MASNQTSYYQLSQWLPEDAVLRTDFNGDNAKIDAALRQLTAGKADKAALDTALSTMEGISGRVPRIVVGTYTGNGEASRFISLGFAPKAVYVCDEEGATRYSDGTRLYYGGLALAGEPVRATANSADYPVVQIEGGGFSVYYKDDRRYKDILVVSNNQNTVYHYVALA